MIFANFNPEANYKSRLNKLKSAAENKNEQSVQDCVQRCPLLQYVCTLILYYVDNWYIFKVLSLVHVTFFIKFQCN